MNRAVPASLSFAAVLVAAGLSVPPAHAQFLEPGLDRAQFEQRLRQPTLRLTTLGRVQLVLEDENNEINQWDFGQSTVGLLDDRTGNSLDAFLDHGDRTNRHEVGGLTRETFRANGTVFGISGSARNKDVFVFGFDAGIQGLGTGLPRDIGTYAKDDVTLRAGGVTAGGRLAARKLAWGARLAFGREEFDHRLKTATFDGDELKLEGGDSFEPVSIFELVEGKSDLFRMGAGLGWMAWSKGDVSLNWDYTAETVRANQNTRRRIYETEEPRRIHTWSLVTTLRPATWATLGGVVGTGGYDVEESYRFSLSLGQGAPPATSRGLRYTRDAEGQFLRSRVSIVPPALSELTIGADFNVNYAKNEGIAAQGPGSFNDFLDFAERNGFILGTHLENELDELRHWDAGVGFGYTPTTRMRFGVEGHRANDARDGTMIHARRRVTDFRGGLEYDLNPEWQARVGGWHRALDEDVHTANNEGVAGAVTFGAGYHPAEKWTLDVGAEILSRSTDYPDPTDGTGSGFRFVLYNRWAFR